MRISSVVPEGKNSNTVTFKELLVSNAEKEMHEQGLLLDKAFEKWKGDIEQIDDVVVIGLRF